MTVRGGPFIEHLSGHSAQTAANSAFARSRPATIDCSAAPRTWNGTVPLPVSRVRRSPPIPERRHHFAPRASRSSISLPQRSASADAIGPQSAPMASPRARGIPLAGKVNATCVAVVVQLEGGAHRSLPYCIPLRSLGLPLSTHTLLAKRNWPGGLTRLSAARLLSSRRRA